MGVFEPDAGHGQIDGRAGLIARFGLDKCQVDVFGPVISKASIRVILGGVTKYNDGFRLTSRRFFGDVPSKMCEGAVAK